MSTPPRTVSARPRAVAQKPETSRARIRRTPEGQSTEWLLRAFALLACSLAVGRLAAAWWLDTTRWTLLLLLITESCTLVLVLMARRAKVRDLSPSAIAATLYAALCFVLLDPAGTVRLVPEQVGVLLLLCGAAWQFGAKLVLGRSFGLLPAQRGLVTSGPYRVMRHPIYCGYLISHIGFLLVNASCWNFAVLSVLCAAQLVRIRREEALLADSRDAQYNRYRCQVRWHVLPFVY